MKNGDDNEMELSKDVNKQAVNYQFKILYFFGIIFIVAGHTDNNGGIALFNDWFIPYAFHVGLFVFASGYFYKRTRQSNIIHYIKNKFIHLIVPLYLWNVFYGVLVYVLRYRDFTIGGDFTIRNLLLTPITTGHQFAYNLAGWFLIPLFMIEVCNIIFRKILEKLKIENEFLIFALYLTAGLCGAWLSMNGYNSGWLLVLVRMLYFMPFFGLGMLYNAKLEKKDIAPSVIYFIIVFILQLAVITKYGSPVTYSASWCNDFDNMYMPFVVGALGIAFWLRISRVLVPVLKDSKLMNYIANHTFSIMIHQFLGFMFLKFIFSLGNKYLSLFPNFDWLEYKTNIFYYYLPKGIEQYTILYLIAGLMLPLAIAYIVGCVKKQFKKYVNRDLRKSTENNLN